MNRPHIKSAVLAYSGGLDTSIIIPWLHETYGCKVIAMIADVGQPEDVEAARQKALATGAVEAIVEDLRDPFLTDFAFPALRAGAIYENGYLLGTSLGRPLIARRQAEIAVERGADALVHGCTGKGNDQVRFELAYRAFAPDIPVIAPWREWAIRSREDAIRYARAHGIPVPVTKKEPWSRDANLWHTSHEGGILEDPATPPPANLFVRTASPADAPREDRLVTIGFEGGVPVSVDGRRRSPVPLVKVLNDLAGRYGIGRADIVENRVVGIKSRGVYETPGGTLLAAAHRELESLVLDRDTSHYKAVVAVRFAELIYDGLWWTPLREALQAFVDTTQDVVTGTVALRLSAGRFTVESRTSPFSLYSASLGSFTMGEDYDQRDAAGLIRLMGLPSAIRARQHVLGIAAKSMAGGRES